jgi:hypothetical protein
MELREILNTRIKASDVFEVISLLPSYVVVFIIAVISLLVVVLLLSINPSQTLHTAPSGGAANWSYSQAFNGTSNMQDGNVSANGSSTQAQGSGASSDPFSLSSLWLPLFIFVIFGIPILKKMFR